MSTHTAASSASTKMETRELSPAKNAPGFIVLENASGLRAELRADGNLYALRHGVTLINQVLPAPGEPSLTRLYLRTRNAADKTTATALLNTASPATRFTRLDAHAVEWSGLACGLNFRVVLQLHPKNATWFWRVTLSDVGASLATPVLTAELFLAQDIAIADEAAVRNNEAYVSQYIDHAPHATPDWGTVILSRQNQNQHESKNPWLATGCLQGAASYSTDGWQFYGPDHRLTGEPSALRAAALPSTNYQYEFACPAFQTRHITIANNNDASVIASAAATAETIFFAHYIPHHPTASGPDDIAILKTALASIPSLPPPGNAEPQLGTPTIENPLLLPPLSGAPLFQPALATLVGPADTWRHVERDATGTLLSFFTGADSRHVVTRAKETAIERPHGHILRSSEKLFWPAPGVFASTVYAAGIFSAQVCLGNPNINRFLSVVRNHLGLARMQGQRVFVRENATAPWRQLGVPSTFEITPAATRWLYQLDNRLISLTTAASPTDAAITLHTRVLEGAPLEFLVTHHLTLGANEHDLGGRLEIDTATGTATALPSPDALVSQKQHGLAFALAAAPLDALAALGGGELLTPTIAPTEPYLTVQTNATRAFTIALAGSLNGAADAKSLAQKTATTNSSTFSPSALQSFSLSHSDPAVSRLNDILPWFTHNAMIHFATPHGLEQCGGGAWGTRDVCQGPVEWLLATQDYKTVRKILLAVFAQQYPIDGSWPQWFMHAPYKFIQKAHSHGDIVFWPLKALCDYIESSGDFAILSAETGYTDPENFADTGPSETILAHTDRILAQYEARCVTGTALVNYGDGDWDDTLQPASPEHRIRLISAWTVALAYHVFRQFREVCIHLKDTQRIARLDAILEKMRADFNARLIRNKVLSGFAINETPDLHIAPTDLRPLLHPDDKVSGIRYRLIPMTRSMLAHLFTPDQARAHLRIIHENLLFPDGVHLMSETVPYRGGVKTLFDRAETAANFGREIGLQYTHAHIRYIEALALLGEADALWQAVQIINPVGINAVLPQSAPRQANTYFSSSDAAFADRYEAGRRYQEIKTGTVPIRCGWRIYSSGPGLYIHKIISCLLGLRESYGDVVLDPVLPRALDGLRVDWTWRTHRLEITYRVATATSASTRITLNGIELPTTRRDENPYRKGGVRIEAATFAQHLNATDDNHLEITI